jgi:hypothetical protein
MKSFHSYLKIVCITMVFLPTLLCNVSPSIAEEVKRDPQSNIYKYVLKASDKEGHDCLLMCYKTPSGDYFDFVLNYSLSDFNAVSELRGTGVNTNRPLKCIKYPFVLLNIADRVKKLPVKKHGQKRIVFIGDSFTFGEGVPLGCAFPDAINHFLKLYGLLPKWNSINLGRTGADFPVVYKDNFANAMKASPDVIVYVWTINNIPKPDNKTAKSPAKKAGKQYVYLYPEAKPTFTEFDFNAKTVKTFKELYGKTNENNFMEMRRLLVKMNSDAKAAGVSFKVALFPLMEGQPGKYPLTGVHKIMLKMLASERIPAIDLEPQLLHTPADNLRVYDRDHKPNVNAHFISAIALMSYLKITDKNPSSEMSSQKVQKMEDVCGTGFTWDLK